MLNGVIIKVISLSILHMLLSGEGTENKHLQAYEI